MKEREQKRKKHFKSAEKKWIYTQVKVWLFLFSMYTTAARN
jgi:hypothetical protein